MSTDGNKIKVQVSGNTAVYPVDTVLPESASQEDVLAEVGKPIVDAVLSGKDGTLLFHGAPGSGKKYAIWGDWKESKVKWSASSRFQNTCAADALGIVPRVGQQIFAHFEGKLDDGDMHHDCKMTLEVFEVDTKGQVFDLLPMNPATLGHPLAFRMNKVRGLTKHDCSNYDDYLHEIEEAYSNRINADGESNIFVRTSVSHAVKTGGGSHWKRVEGAVTFVDLVGFGDLRPESRPGKSILRQSSLRADGAPAYKNDNVLAKLMDRYFQEDVTLVILASNHASGAKATADALQFGEDIAERFEVEQNLEEKEADEPPPNEQPAAPEKAYSYRGEEEPASRQNSIQQESASYKGRASGSVRARSPPVRGTSLDSVPEEGNAHARAITLEGERIEVQSWQMPGTWLRGTMGKTHVTSSGKPMCRVKLSGGKLLKRVSVTRVRLKNQSVDLRSAGGRRSGTCKAVLDLETFRAQFPNGKLDCLGPAEQGERQVAIHDLRALKNSYDRLQG